MLALLIDRVKAVASAFVTIIGKINWDWFALATKGRYFDLTEQEQDVIREHLRNNYFIILTRRKTHLSTYAINLSHLLLTGRLGYYSHALMNLEDAVKDDSDFRLMESTNKAGVVFASFDTVFDCDSVALLKPKNMSLDEWTVVLDQAKTFEGRKYDTLYDLKDDTKMSCVELVRGALSATPDYATNFANFEKMVSKSKNLDPEMFYECEDFEVVWEIRH